MKNFSSLNQLLQCLQIKLRITSLSGVSHAFFNHQLRVSIVAGHQVLEIGVRNVGVL